MLLGKMGKLEKQMMEMIEIHHHGVKNRKNGWKNAKKKNGGDGANTLHYLHHLVCNCLKMSVVLSVFLFLFEMIDLDGFGRLLFLLIHHFCVDLRGLHIGVTKHLADCIDVGTIG